MEGLQTIKQEEGDYIVTKPEENLETHVLDSTKIKIEPYSYEPQPSPQPNNLDQKFNLTEEAKVIGNSDIYMFDCSLNEISKQKDLEIKLKESEEMRETKKMEDIVHFNWETKNEELNIKDEINIEDKVQGTSRYKRNTNRGNINLENVIHAIKAIKLKNQKLRTVAKLYTLPRTTLRRYLDKVVNEYEDIANVTDEHLKETIKRLCTYSACAVNQVFSPEEEKALVGYINQCSDGFSINELRKLAFLYAKKIQAKHPSAWNTDGMSGRDWYYGFMRRHPQLLSRPPEQTSLHRVKSFSKENVEFFFRNLDSVLSKHQFQAADIWNMDETGFDTVPTNIRKVISLRGTNRVSQERGTMITMALAVNAEGSSVPPFFLFPRQNMQSTFLENASAGAIGFANGSGWMRQAEFVKYMEFFIGKTKASRQSPKLLLLDNHTSHLSIEALDLAVDNGVTLLSFPPHCSHRLQPLDVSVYGTLKTYYKSQCNAWQKNHAGKILEIRHIPSLIRSTLDLALTPRNIKAGFLATGIYPYNPDILADSKFVDGPYSGENIEADARAEVYDEDLYVAEVGAHERIASSTEPLASTSRDSNLSSILTSIGPLQAAKSTERNLNRGQRPIKSANLTTPENFDILREKRDTSQAPNKRLAPNLTRTTNKTPAKRGRPLKKSQKKTFSGDDED